MKNRNLIIGIVLAVLLLGGGFYFLSQKKAPETETAVFGPTEAPVLSLTPEDIGLTLTSTIGNRKVILGVSKTQDIASLDYELSYLSKGDIPRGAIGHVDITTKGAPISKEIILGTCSDTCHYDEGVTSVTVLLKITKTDDKIYQVEKTLEF